MRAVTPTQLERALHRLLTTDALLHAWSPGVALARLHDDTDGQTDPEQWLTVTPLADTAIQVAVGEHAFLFRTTGPSPHVARALGVVAEAIRRDNADRPRGGPLTTVPPPPGLGPAVAQALDVALETPFFPPSLRAEQGHRRWDDDSVAPKRVEGLFTVYIGHDSDVHLLAGWPSLRFRDYFGGGQSLRVRNALLVLADAIQRDARVTDQGV